MRQAGSGTRPEMGSERGFGIVFACLFLIVAAWPLAGGGSIRLWAIGVAAALALVALLRPGLLRGPNRLWFAFGMALGAVIAPLVLAVVFFLTVTPIGLAMRALGKDPLRLKRDAKARTYWIARDEPMGSMKNQY